MGISEYSTVATFVRWKRTDPARCTVQRRAEFDSRLQVDFRRWSILQWSCNLRNGTDLYSADSANRTTWIPTSLQPANPASCITTRNTSSDASGLSSNHTASHATGYTASHTASYTTHHSTGRTADHTPSIFASQSSDKSTSPTTNTSTCKSASRSPSKSTSRTANHASIGPSGTLL